MERASKCNLLIILCYLALIVVPYTSFLLWHPNYPDYSRHLSFFKTNNDTPVHGTSRDPSLDVLAAKHSEYEIQTKNEAEEVASVGLENHVRNPIRRIHHSHRNVPHNATIHRMKRNSAQLMGMIMCATSQPPLSYNNYGCYCGLGGSGTPVDRIDRCCQAHDNCYDQQIRRNKGSSKYFPYLITYKWSCRRKIPKCWHDRGWSLCKCDQIFAICLKYLPRPHSKPGCPKN